MLGVSKMSRLYSLFACSILACTAETGDASNATYRSKDSGWYPSIVSCGDDALIALQGRDLSAGVRTKVNPVALISGAPADDTSSVRYHVDFHVGEHANCEEGHKFVLPVGYNYNTWIAMGVIVIKEFEQIGVGRKLQAEFFLRKPGTSSEDVKWVSFEHCAYHPDGLTALRNLIKKEATGEQNGAQECGSDALTDESLRRNGRGTR